MDPIRHVVVLMFENHSFDQMVGALKEICPQMEGVDPHHFGMNVAGAAQFLQRPSSDIIVSPDPKHEVEHILNSLDNHNSGFVAEYAREYPGLTPAQLQRIMDYFPLDSLPALHALAREFMVCDHWFSSVPGPTWANRFFVHSATSLGRVKMPDGADQDPRLYLGYNQDTIYDRLTAAGKSWTIYHGDVPQTLVFEHMQHPENRARYRWLDRFFDDAQGPESGFPEYVFLEPNYFHIPFERPQNDDHPPHSAMEAQKLLAAVYNALRSNTDLWNSLLLIVVYDENGGFYDHVEPPQAVPPDGHHDEYTFDRLGVRVPAVLVSPWVERGVLSTVFDHTSVLKFLSKKWQLPSLTERDRTANSFEGAMTRTEPRTDTLASILLPPPVVAAAAAVAPAEPTELNGFQESLAGLSRHLQGEPLIRTAADRALLPDPVTRARHVRRRIDDYLHPRK